MKGTVGSPRRQRRASLLRAMAGVVGAVLVLLLGSIRHVHAEAVEEDEAFDHLQTGFPLTGPHRLVKCETCHQRAIFRGTPIACEGCHMLGRVAVTVKPANHVPAGNRCDDCHTPYAWVPARFEHGSATAPCIACHNGVTASGKSAGHIPAGSTCEDCHGTRRWAPSNFTHDATSLPCIACHNGSAATGKPANHIPASGSCEVCHATRRWKPTRFTHDLTTLPCVTCHNNRSVEGKSKDHIPSPDTCESCHGTNAWKPVSFTP